MTTTVQPETHENQAIELIKKRQRFLKKKLGKIEKYESEPRESLNDDQIEAISRKMEVQTALKELDEVLQKVELVEKEHEQQLLQVRKDTLKEVEMKDKESLKHIHRINYALGMPLAQLIGKHEIKDVEYDCLKLAQDLLMKPILTKSFLKLIVNHNL